MESEDLTNVWLVWSNEHKGWWRRDGNGYSQHVIDAKRFSYQEACAVVHQSNQHRWFCLAEPHETMVPITSLPDHPNTYAQSDSKWKFAPKRHERS